MYSPFLLGNWQSPYKFTHKVSITFIAYSIAELLIFVLFTDGENERCFQQFLFSVPAPSIDMLLYIV